MAVGMSAETQSLMVSGPGLCYLYPQMEGLESVAGKGQIQAIARKSHVFEINIPLLFNYPLPGMFFH